MSVIANGIKSPNNSGKQISKLEMKIQELRHAVQDIITKGNKEYEDEYNLLRWLRAQNMDVKKAEKMLRNVSKTTVIFGRSALNTCTAHKWKIENNVEQLVYDDLPLDLMETMRVYVDGMTSNGIPVGSVEAGKVDFVRQLRIMGREKVLRYCIQVFAQAEKFILECNCLNNANKSIQEDSFKGAIAIVDFNEFSSKQMRSFEAVRTSIEVCKIMMKFFPDLGSELICINCNTVSAAILRVLRPIVETQHLTFQVFGTDQREWKAAILSKVPANQIRPPFGGTREEKQVLVKPSCLQRPSESE